MEKKDCIDLAVLCIVFASIFMLCSRADDRNLNHESQVVEGQTLETQGNATMEEYYYLAELNGYVVVYKSDKETIYEYTNILVEELPEEVRAEIQTGKKMEGMKSVYGFLENYSS